MVARNTRVAPDTQVRSPARSFLNSLDNFYAPQRDTRKEAAFQEGLSGFSGILQEQADRNKRTQREGEYQQGVQDALREQAGEELKGVKTGSLFRQHSSFYMAGLNETRGKAKAAQFKAHIARAYQDWEGKHTDDDGSAFREWMNNEIGVFMGGLGEDQHMVAGALPVITEVATNYASQHTAFTNQRLETESFEAYDEIVSGVFTDLATGQLDMDAAVDQIAAEADDMYATDGAAANDRVVQAAIRYANIHNDPDAILALARAHDSGKLKLSQMNRERLANAMDAVEADIQRNAAKQNAADSAAATAAREAALNDWASTLQENPYAELPTFSDVGDRKTYQEMVRLQDSFIKGNGVENPVITNTQRMSLEQDLHAAQSPQEKLKIVNDFVANNPEALSSADVSKYTREVFETTNPGSLVNNPTVTRYRSGFGRTLAEFQLGDGFDVNRSSYLQTQGERHFNDYMMASAGSVDMNDPRAVRQAIKDAEEYAMEQLAFDFPEVLREKNEQGPLGDQLGVDGALETRDAVVAEQAKQVYEQLAGAEGAAQSADEEPEVNPEADADGNVSPGVDLPLEEQPEPYDDPNSDEEYPPTRAGFYGEMIQRFTDGKDTRNGQTMVDIVGDVFAEDPEFHAEVKSLADELNVPMGALLAVMHFETGGTFSTNVRNAAGSGATGLIQFMPKTAASLGTSTAALAGMSRKEQMTYVRKYFHQFPQIKGGSVDDVYMAVLWPKAVGKPDGYPIFHKGTIAYQQNAGLDTNGDGTVTKFEAAAKVRQRFYGG